VDTQVPLQSLTWDSQPLPAYQYFENVRNFLVAAAELKLPAFEASDLERVCNLCCHVIVYMCEKMV
jgi:kinesin family protein C2/C3